MTDRFYGVSPDKPEYQEVLKLVKFMQSMDFPLSSMRRILKKEGLPKATLNPLIKKLASRNIQWVTHSKYEMSADFAKSVDMGVIGRINSTDVIWDDHA